MHLVPLTRRLRWSYLALVLLATAPAAQACTIPVFRYALERWELSPYDILVFHRGDLPAATGSFLDALPHTANVTVTRIDLDGSVAPDVNKLWQQHGRPATLPWVIVRRPEGAKAPPAWTGPLDPITLRRFIESPCRRKAIGSLERGSSGVFVLLQSGDPAADGAVQNLLAQHLAKLETLIKLPEQSGEGPRIRLALPLKVSFTVLALKRDDPEEDAFVQLLLRSEADLARVRGPIVFPIFGRGRLLGSLYGKDLDANTLLEVVSFLCGECSCQVKELNPGMDLPIAADWSAIFERIGPAAESGPPTPLGVTRHGARAKALAGLLPFAVGVSKEGDRDVGNVRVALSDDPTVTHDTSGRIEATKPEPAPHRRWLWCATVAAAVLVVISGAWVLARGVGRRGGKGIDVDGSQP
jgi:hypothetical protein